MAKTRQQKEEVVADLQDKMSRAKSVAFAQISGFTMADANTLRDEAHKEGLDTGIVKKTLVEIAAKASGIEFGSDTLSGSTLAVFGYADEVAPARVLSKFIKGRETMSITAGIIDGKVVGAEVVSAYASLPSRDELLAKLVGTINRPVSGFVNVLAGNLRGLANVLNAIKDTKASA